MNDITILRHGVVADVEGITAEGEEFVDRWQLGTLTVVDAGRIKITSEVVSQFLKDALIEGLDVEMED